MISYYDIIIKLINLHRIIIERLNQTQIIFLNPFSVNIQALFKLNFDCYGSLLVKIEN